MTPIELLESKKQEIDALCRRFEVKRLRVFGSALTGEWDEDRSDFDFLVEYRPEYRALPPLERLVGLKLALEDLLGRDVDVVNRAFARNQFFLENAEAKAEEFYAA
jgi:predicted nucleotidyltransferase